MNKYLVVFLFAFLVLSCNNINKTPPVDLSGKDVSIIKVSPKIGIAFGGGGAKAVSHIGILKVIEEAGVPINYVAGSSMGAVIGGLYAAGYTAEEIDSLFMTEEWLSLFDRNELGITLEYSERTIFGLVKGDEFQEHLSQVLARKGCYKIEDTERLNKIKFCCTATKVINEESLEEVDLDSGNMARAIRASLTYPAPIVGYKPVIWNGQKLVDGGMLNNLPVDVVRKLGAKKVIAIDLESSDKGNGELPLSISQIRSYIGITIPMEDVLGIRWLVNWLSNHSESNEKRRRNYEDADIKLRPDLQGYGILSFNEKAFDEMIDAGEKEARSCFEDIVNLK